MELSLYRYCLCDDGAAHAVVLLVPLSQCFVLASAGLTAPAVHMSQPHAYERGYETTDGGE